MASSADSAAIGHRLILILALGLGMYLAVSSVALLAFGGGERLESSLYVGTFVIVLPAAVLAGTSMARRLERLGTLASVALPASSGLLALLVSARLAYALGASATIGTPAFAAALAIWAVATAAVVRAALHGSRPKLPGRAAPTDTRLLALTAALLAVLLLGFPPSRVFGASELAATVAIVLVLLVTYAGLARRTPGRRLGAAADLLAIGVLVLLANDLWLYREPNDFYELTSNLHQNFYLGPTNDVMHGRPMLVETFSQYGVALFYFLAGWFALSEIGYGAMTLLCSLLGAAQIALVYGILRLARASRPLAFAGGAVAGISLFFAGEMPPPTSHPSIGGLRYLLPYIVLALAMAGARSLTGTRRWWWASAAAVGVSSIWSIETFAYSASAFAGMALLRAGLGGAPRRELARALLAPAIAVLAAHAGFVVLTRALAGTWPDWGGYLAFLGSYSVDGISALPVEPWSPGIAICAAYFASTVGLLVLMRGGPAAVVREERVALLGIAGAVPFGLVSFAYFVGNSFPDAALPVGLPCALTVGLWLTILERHRERVPPLLRRGAAVAAAWLVATLAVFAWPTIEDRGSDTPVALALPDSGSGGSITDELSRMWRSAPLDARYDPAEALIRTHFPGDGPVLAAASTESTVTALMQTGRVNAFPISHFLQEGLVMERSWPRVRETIDGLRPGALLFTEATALGSAYPAPLLDRTLSELRRRFRLAYVDGDPNGFLVVRLVPLGT